MIAQVGADVAKARELLEKLGPLLEMGDPRCMEYRDDVRDVLSPLGGETAALLAQMDAFDFEQAHATALKILEVVEANNE